MNQKKNLKWLWIAAVLVILILAAFLGEGCLKKQEPVHAKTPVVKIDSVKQPEEKLSNTVEAQIRNVDFHIADGIILQIKNLRGRLLPAEGFPHPVFNKKESYILDIYSAEIKMDMQSLSTLLNNYVFAYKGSSLKNIHVSIAGNQVKQEGKMKGIPFTILSDISVTPEGIIKLHPTDVKAFGIEMNGLLKLFHIEMKDLISGNAATGLKIIDNDLFLDPVIMLPPPKIKGHLKSVVAGDGELTQVFFSKNAVPLKPPYAKANYMYFRGGYLTFGKLTMRDTDMQIIDKDPKDPFDFFNDHYFEQLVASYHKTTSADGLVIFMPDYSKMK